MNRLVPVFMLAAFALPVVALADDPRPAIRAACKSDVQANCGVVFSRDKAIACLIDNASKLSSGCSKALEVASCNPKAPANVKAAFPCSN